MSQISFLSVSSSTATILLEFKHSRKSWRTGKVLSANHPKHMPLRWQGLSQFVVTQASLFPIQSSDRPSNFTDNKHDCYSQLSFYIHLCHILLPELLMACHPQTTIIHGTSITCESLPQHFDSYICKHAFQRPTPLIWTLSSLAQPSASSPASKAYV